jgi:hypothetical protein
MELSELILPLVFILVAVFQFFTRKKKKPGEEEPSPFPDDFDPNVPVEGQEYDPTWDDLMESLGHKKEMPPPALPHRQESSSPPQEADRPPPLPANQHRDLRRPLDLPQVDPSATMAYWQSQIESLQHKTEAVQKQARAFSDRKGVSFAGASKTLPRQRPGFSVHQLRLTLTDPTQIRQAILINEILQKPIALREPGSLIR